MVVTAVNQTLNAIYCKIITNDTQMQWLSKGFSDYFRRIYSLEIGKFKTYKLKFYLNKITHENTSSCEIR